MKNSNIKELELYLQKQLDETYDEIRWAETHNHPANEALVEVLNYRKAFQLTQLDNLKYELSLNK
jgi:hypothetical protein